MFRGGKRTPLDCPSRGESEKAMINVMFKTLFLLIATLAASACQPADENLEDTDTTPECGEGETAVVPWCEDALAVMDDISCNQCGHEDSCDYKGSTTFVCDILSSNYGKLPDCVSDDDAAHCLAEITKDACAEENYPWWENCYGFSLAE